MPRIVLFHDDLNALGGAERVCLGFIEVAQEIGLETTLVTTVPPDWNRIRSIFGRKTMPDSWESLLSGPKRFEKYDRVLMTSLAKRFRRDSVAINTAGCRWLPVRTEATYEHTPPVTLLTTPRSGVTFRKRVYYAPFDLLQISLLRTGRARVLTNSRYCANRLRWSNKPVQVLYPPVDYEPAEGAGRRKDVVITCGRYDRAKNYEVVINAASSLPGLQFVVMGTANSSEALVYHSKLAKLAENLHVTNVNFLQNVPRQSQIETYRTAKVYLHTTVGEDFGIAAVEAMGSGLIPIVHKSGGLWEDVIRKGELGFGYSNVTEAVQAIDTACKGWAELKGRVVARSKEFGRDVFTREAAAFMRRLVAKVEHSDIGDLL